MEEKPRYEYYEETNHLYDNEKGELYAYNLNKNKIISILNQQDKRIKELEQENNFLEKRNEELIIDRRDICLERNDIFEENQQLKQAQNKKAIEVLEEIRKTIRYAKEICGGKATDLDIITADAYNRCLDDMQKIIDNQIKELKGEKE